jgi:uncharacterized protein (TIGR02246 family)
MEAKTMNRLAALIGVTVIALMATACNQPADTHNADVQALKNNETQWIQDWASRDADKIAAHYANDAVMMAPGEAAISGKEAIQNGLKQMVSDPTMSLKFQTSKVDVAKSGDLAYTRGTYTMMMTDPQSKHTINDHGSYVTVYRKLADGTWKSVADIATSEVPPPTPTAAPTKKHKSSHPNRRR